MAAWLLYRFGQRSPSQAQAVCMMLIRRTRTFYSLRCRWKPSFMDPRTNKVHSTIVTLYTKHRNHTPQLVATAVNLSWRGGLAFKRKDITK